MSDPALRFDVQRDLLDESSSTQHDELRVRVDQAAAEVRQRGLRSRSASWLRELGLLDAPASVRLATGFRCSVTATTLRAECRLRSCRYHVDYEWSANCLLAYMHQQRVESLSVDEISFLYRVPAEIVKQKLDDATALLRAQALEVQASTDQVLGRRFRHLVGARLCLVCESSLDDEPVPRNLQVDNIGQYCSKDCREEKPPRVIELEVAKGLPIAQILEWTFRRYRSLSLAEQALQMPRWLVYDACRRYLDRPLEDFFPALRQVQNQRRSALIRRTWHTPRWVTALTQRLRPMLDAAARRFGAPTVDTEALRRQLSHLLETV